MIAVQSAGLVVLLAIALWFGLGFLCSKIAADKGRSAGAFFLLGLFFPVVTLIVVLAIQAPQFRTGDIVRLATDVHLADGTSLRRGWRTQINEVSVIDNTRVVSVIDDRGQQRWIAAKAVRLTS